MSGSLQGYRTIAFNAAVIGLVPVLQYIGGLDLTALLGPVGSLVAMGAINIGLRYLSTTPVGTSEREVTVVKNDTGKVIAGAIAGKIVEVIDKRTNQKVAG